MNVLPNSRVVTSVGSRYARLHGLIEGKLETLLVYLRLLGTTSHYQATYVLLPFIFLQKQREWSRVTRVMGFY